jgi:cytochrome c553
VQLNSASNHTRACIKFATRIPFSSVRIFVLLALALDGGCEINQASNHEDLETAPSLREEPVGADIIRPSSQKRSRTCGKCHEDHFKLWTYGGHNKVSCESCHGSAGKHVLQDIDPRPKMKLRGKADLCLSCHGHSSEKIKDEIPRIVSLEAHVRYVGEKHSVFTDIEKTKGRCIFCHDPHSLE